MTESEHDPISAQHPRPHAHQHHQSSLHSHLQHHQPLRNVGFLDSTFHQYLYSSRLLVGTTRDCQHHITLHLLRQLCNQKHSAHIAPLGQTSVEINRVSVDSQSVVHTHPHNKPHPTSVGSHPHVYSQRQFHWVVEMDCVFNGHAAGKDIIKAIINEGFWRGAIASGFVGWNIPGVHFTISRNVGRCRFGYLHGSPR